MIDLHYRYALETVVSIKPQSSFRKKKKTGVNCVPLRRADWESYDSEVINVWIFEYED